MATEIAGVQKEVKVILTKPRLYDRRYDHQIWWVVLVHLLAISKVVSLFSGLEIVYF